MLTNELTVLHVAKCTHHIYYGAQLACFDQRSVIARLLCFAARVPHWVKLPPANRFFIEGLWMMKRRRPMRKILNRRALWLTNVWTTHGGWMSLRPASLKITDIWQHNTMHSAAICSTTSSLVHLTTAVSTLKCIRHNRCSALKNSQSHTDMHTPSTNSTVNNNIQNIDYKQRVTISLDCQHTHVDRYSE